jgi:signal transduction histidine kinase
MDDRSEEAFQNKEKYKRNLTLRYGLALGLIALVLCFSYFFLVYKIQSNREDAHIINISGKQRMLSQRIALFSREIYHANSQEEADLYAGKMRGALETMIADHRELIDSGYNQKGQKSHSEEIKNIYYGSEGINKRIEHYIDKADSFLTLYENGGLQDVRQTDLMIDIVSVARNGLLQELDRAVNQYQKEYEQSVDRFKSYEKCFFLLGLLILLLEIVFIFRPMVKEIIKRREELETANQELREFSYRISHDLKAPITSSFGISKIARSSIEKGNKEEALQALDHIQSSMKRLQALIGDVLNLTRMRVNNAPSMTKFSIENVLMDVLANLSDMINDNNVQIKNNINLSEPIIMEKIYLQQSLENLISNAIKYHDPDKEEPYVEISADLKDNNYIFSVRDNGLGIPKDSQANIFGMFQRFHPKKSFGSGLGLYLVKQNIQRLGGIIKYNPLNAGSEFIIKIPKTTMSS